MNKNVLLLSLCQALLVTGNVLLVSVSALVGKQLSNDPRFITLAVATQFAGLLIATIPASLIMQRIGRKRGFYLGNVIGISGALLCILAIQSSSLMLYCSGTLLLGMGIGFGNFYRFAAVEVCADSYKARAISLTLAGGVLAAFLGPNLASYAHDWVGTGSFIGAFVVLLALYCLALLLISQIDMPAPQPFEPQDTPRPLLEVMSQPLFIIAVVAGMCSYIVMSLVMTATPLAMDRCGFNFRETALVIEWHVLGMFAPAFITGKLIDRFGSTSIILTGMLLSVACLLLNINGQSYGHFSLALILLGVGWNFMFTSATHLVTMTYRPSEKAKTQACNEFLVFSMVTLSTFYSGWLEATIGWVNMNWLMLPVLMLAAALVIFHRFKGRVAV